MRDKRVTPARALAGLALLASLGVSVPSCLPSLDPSLEQGFLCSGGVPDGILDPGSAAAGTLPEECDDGNTVAGDGCDGTCHVECNPPSVKDPHTLHCYTIVPTNADDTTDCVSAGTTSATEATSWLVTVRTNSERDVLRSLIDLQGTSDAHYLAGYAIALNQALPVQTATVNEVLATQESGEPGILESTTAKSNFVCSGCYDGASGTFWSDADTTSDFVALDGDANFGVVSAKPAQAICERVPPGIAQEVCGADCSNGAATEKRLRAPGATAASTYSYFDVTATVDDAETKCESLGSGGHLLWLETEEERELVTRQFATELQQITWVGMRKTNKVWTWSDGVADGAGRPYFWWQSADKTSEPIADPALPLECATLLKPATASYGTGLLGAYACGASSSKVTAAYLCKRPSP